MAQAPSIATTNKLTISGDSEHAWKAFKQRFELYVTASGYKNNSDEEKVALLLTMGGEDIMDISNS